MALSPEKRTAKLFEDYPYDSRLEDWLVKNFRDAERDAIEDAAAESARLRAALQAIARCSKDAWAVQYANKVLKGEEG